MYTERGESITPAQKKCDFLYLLKSIPNGTLWKQVGGARWQPVEGGKQGASAVKPFITVAVNMFAGISTSAPAWCGNCLPATAAAAAFYISTGC